jgi:hypothetical protein
MVLVTPVRRLSSGAFPPTCAPLVPGPDGSLTLTGRCKNARPFSAYRLDGELATEAERQSRQVMQISDVLVDLGMMPI